MNRVDAPGAVLDMSRGVICTECDGVICDRCICTYDTVAMMAPVTVHV